MHQHDVQHACSALVLAHTVEHTALLEYLAHAVCMLPHFGISKLAAQLRVVLCAGDHGPLCAVSHSSDVRHLMYT